MTVPGSGSLCWSVSTDLTPHPGHFLYPPLETQGVVLPAGQPHFLGAQKWTRSSDLQGMHHRSRAPFNHLELHPSWVSCCLLFPTTKSGADAKHSPFKRIAFAGNDGKSYFWDRPSKVGEVAFFPNGTQFRRGPRSGTSAFITHERLKSRDFIKGGDVYILLTVEGMAMSIVPLKLLLSLL